MTQKKAKKKKIEPKSRDPYKRRKEAEMARIIQEIQSGMIGVRAACRKYGLCRKTLMHWITRLSVRTLSNELSTQVLFGMTGDAKSQAADKKIKELKQALELARLKIDGLETMIKVAEEDLHIKIRKKAGTKQSKE